MLWPLIKAQKNNEYRKVIDLLCNSSQEFAPQGVNSSKTLSQIKNRAIELIDGLLSLWNKNNNVGDILRYCRKNQLCYISDRLSEYLDKKLPDIEYDSNVHSEIKSEWLARDFFAMPSNEIGNYVEFICDNTPYSTQHGVKGEEYKNVVVVFDDIEAAWNNYNFTKMLTPNIFGSPTEGQYNRSQKLAYVCFSRAEDNLRILLFTPNPNSVKQDLISRNLFQKSQIECIS